MQDEGSQDHNPVVQAGQWVSLRYRLYDSNGQPLEDGEREQSYLHGGFGQLFPKLETMLEGRRPGERVSVYLQPEESFGDYDSELLHVVPRVHFPAELEVGMDFEGIPGASAPDGIYTVTDIADDAVVIDGNHPLAGIAIRFDLEVLEVRPASHEEIADARARAEEAD